MFSLCAGLYATKIFCISCLVVKVVQSEEINNCMETVRGVLNNHQLEDLSENSPIR